MLEPLLPQAEAAGPARLPRALRLRQGACARSASTRAPSPRSPPWWSSARTADLLPRALYVLGSSRSIVDQARGPETYERLAREFPDHSFADDALFYAADLYVKTGRPEQALARLDELAQLYPQGDFLGEALFKAFWIAAHAEGARTAALARPGPDRAALRQRGRDLRRGARAVLAGAHAAGARATAEGAAELFEQLAVEHPATYYGLMARSQLGELDPARAGARRAAAGLHAPERREPLAAVRGPLEKDPHFLAGVELLRLGFPEAVSSELLAVNRTEPARRVHAAAGARCCRWPATSARRTRWRALALRRDLSGPHHPADAAGVGGGLSQRLPRADREAHRGGGRGAGPAPGADARGERAGSQGAVLGRRAGAHPADALHGEGGGARS